MHGAGANAPKVISHQNFTPSDQRVVPVLNSFNRRQNIGRISSLCAASCASKASCSLHAVFLPTANRASPNRFTSEPVAIKIVSKCGISSPCCISTFHPTLLKSVPQQSVWWESRRWCFLTLPAWVPNCLSFTRICWTERQWVWICTRVLQSRGSVRLVHLHQLRLVKDMELQEDLVELTNELLL